MESNKLCPIEVWSRILVSSYLFCIVPCIHGVNISLTMENRITSIRSVGLLKNTSDRTKITLSSDFFIYLLAFPNPRNSALHVLL